MAREIHGQSADTTQPDRVYTMRGYAETAIELMKTLESGPYVVVGWSLGGHIGIEMLAQHKDIRGLVISGTPPVSHDTGEMAQAFLPHENMGATGKEHPTEAELDAYAHTTCGDRRLGSAKPGNHPGLSARCRHNRSGRVADPAGTFGIHAGTMCQKWNQRTDAAVAGPRSRETLCQQ